jgi:hypothetical protein
MESEQNLILANIQNDETRAITYLINWLMSKMARTLCHHYGGNPYVAFSGPRLCGAGETIIDLAYSLGMEPSYKSFEPLILSFADHESDPVVQGTAPKT